MRLLGAVLHKRSQVGIRQAYCNRSVVCPYQSQLQGMCAMRETYTLDCHLLLGSTRGNVQ